MRAPPVAGLPGRKQCRAGRVSAHRGWCAAPQWPLHKALFLSLGLQKQETNKQTKNNYSIIVCHISSVTGRLLYGALFLPSFSHSHPPSLTSAFVCPAPQTEKYTKFITTAISGPRKSLYSFYNPDYFEVLLSSLYFLRRENRGQKLLEAELHAAWAEKCLRAEEPLLSGAGKCYQGRGRSLLVGTAKEASPWCTLSCEGQSPCSTALKWDSPFKTSQNPLFFINCHPDFSTPQKPTFLSTDNQFTVTTKGKTCWKDLQLFFTETLHIIMARFHLLYYRNLLAIIRLISYFNVIMFGLCSNKSLNQNWKIRNSNTLSLLKIKCWKKGDVA